MSEEKKRSGRKLSAWISDKLYDDLQALGYFGRRISQTETLTRALELLLTESKKGDKREMPGDTRETVGDTRETVGDTGRLGELESKVGDMQELINEKDRHIKTLKTELEKSGEREENLKETHRNYMLQVQTLINQKAIEAPGAKKPFWKFW